MNVLKNFGKITSELYTARFDIKRAYDVEDNNLTYQEEHIQKDIPCRLWPTPTKTFGSQVDLQVKMSAPKRFLDCSPGTDVRVGDTVFVEGEDFIVHDLQEKVLPVGPIVHRRRRTPLAVVGAPQSLFVTLRSERDAEAVR